LFVDLPLEQLRGYRPEVAEPADFDEFWAKQMAAARAVGEEPAYAPVDRGIASADVFDVRFTGYGGTRVTGWLQLPHRVRDGAPLIVQFIGYNGGRGDPLDWLTWPALGFPHFVMDSRGQGGGWRTADTPDPDDAGAPSTNGFMTRGIADPASYYFTRLFVDAARALETLREHPAADNGVVVTGGSQGGALALVAAHLAGGARAVLPDVPFLAHPRRAVEVTDAPPFGELIEYCALHNDRAAQVFSTLSYIDVVNHGKRVSAPALFSVGLLDPITPASTIFTAYNYYAGPKDIRVYPFNGHEGGGVQQVRAQFDFLAGLNSETGRS
jgi:cephalosporin-C deacetylase